jgi:hypothetical protein
MAQLHIPPLYCPFAPALSQNVDLLALHALEWAQRFHLLDGEGAYERFVAERHWRLVARAYPDADIEDLELIADWNTWGFYLDDLGDASAAGRDAGQMQHTFDAILDVLQDQPVVREGALFESLADIWRRILPQSSSQWREHLRQTLAISFSSYLWEAGNRTRDVTPTHETYVHMRIFTGAWLTYLRLFELVEAVSLPAEIRYHPMFQAYLMAVNDVIVWANDIVSSEKERAQRDLHNLVFIVEREERRTTQEAINLLVYHHNEEMLRCLALERKLAAVAGSARQDVEKYIHFARSFIRANLDWAGETSRYGGEAGNLHLTLSQTYPPPPITGPIPPIGISQTTFRVLLALAGIGGFIAGMSLRRSRHRR